MRSTFVFTLVLGASACAAPTTLPYRGFGPIPRGAADRAVAKLGDRYADALARFAAVRSVRSVRSVQAATTAISADQALRELRTAELFQAEARRIPTSSLSAAYAIDRSLILTHSEALIAERTGAPITLERRIALIVGQPIALELLAREAIADAQRRAPEIAHATRASGTPPLELRQPARSPLRRALSTGALSEGWALCLREQEGPATPELSWEIFELAARAALELAEGDPDRIAQAIAPLISAGANHAVITALLAQTATGRFAPSYASYWAYRQLGASPEALRELGPLPPAIAEVALRQGLSR